MPLDERDSEIEALRKRQAELEEQVRELQSTVAAALERNRGVLDKMDSRVSQVYAKNQHLQRDMTSILESRIWRSLVAAGGSALRIRNWVKTRNAPALPGPAGDALPRVFCDEPAGTTAPLSGRVKVRGWAAAAAGIARVEALLPGRDPIPLRHGFYRPDIARAFPQLDGAANSGFAGAIDTMALRNGTYSVTIRAYSNDNSHSDAAVTLAVDHILGFADDYSRWRREFEQRDAALIQLKLHSFRDPPLIAILTPVYNTNPALLTKAIESVVQQSYQNWELILVDDGSATADAGLVMDRFAALDKRIRAIRHETNRGIAAASNTALAAASGAYIALLDHDDELDRDALFHMADAIDENPEAGIFYSDEDHIDEAGRRSDPFFKPDWSPDLILSENYVCHFMVFRAALGREVGGFRSEVDTAQDYDILLRMSRRAGRIVHVPRILYHWRTAVTPDVADRASFQVDKALAASRRAVEDYIAQTAPGARVEEGRIKERWRIRYPIPKQAEVCIVIPTALRSDFNLCLQSIASRTDFPRYRLLLVDNSPGGAAARLAREWGSKHGKHVSVMDRQGQPFNFSAWMNDAARQAASEGGGDPLLLFLNDDTEVLRPDWLTSMVELASRPDTGIVGAKLLYPGGGIQHAGIVMGIFGIAGHAFRGHPHEDRGFFDFPDMVRNVSAVTGACLMIRSSVFFQVGGFEAERLPVAYQDVDLCLKVGELGLKVLYNPYALLRHYEALSKGADTLDPKSGETAYLKKRWAAVIEADPFYNPNLTTTREDYSPRSKG